MILAFFAFFGVAAAAMAGQRVSHRELRQQEHPDHNAFIRFAHVASMGEIEILVNGQTVVSAMESGDASSYIQVPLNGRGSRLQVRSTEGSSNDLVDLTVHHNKIKYAYYTAALSDAQHGGKQLIATLIEDVGVSEPTFASVRFVALSADAGLMDVDYKAGELEYKSVQHGFTEVSHYHRLPAVGTPYSIKVTLTEKGKEFLRPLQVFSPGSVYSVYAMGKVADGTFKLVVLKDEHHHSDVHRRFDPLNDF